MGCGGGDKLNPAHVYAFEKLGYLVTTENAEQFTDDELAAWDAAVAEFERKAEGDGEED